MLYGVYKYLRDNRLLLIKGFESNGIRKIEFKLMRPKNIIPPTEKGIMKKIMNDIEQYGPNEVMLYFKNYNDYFVPYTYLFVNRDLLEIDPHLEIELKHAPIIFEKLYQE